MSSHSGWTLDRIIAPPVIEQRDALSLAGLRARYAFEGFDPAIYAAQVARMMSQAGALGDRIGHTLYEAYFDLHAGEHSFEFFCGVPVAGRAAIPPGFVRLTLPAQLYAVFTHRGHVMDLPRTMAAIWCDWLPQSGHARAVGPEMLAVYDHRFDPHTHSGEIDILVPVMG